MVDGVDEGSAAMRGSDACGKAVQARDDMIDRLRAALADAVRSPMGVVPDSALLYLTQDDIEAAERRRVMKSSIYGVDSGEEAARRRFLGEGK